MNLALFPSRPNTLTSPSQQSSAAGQVVIIVESLACVDGPTDTIEELQVEKTLRNRRDSEDVEGAEGESRRWYP